MTDKTKPWFNKNHPEYALVDAARHRLYDSPDFPRDIVNGTGVGISADNQNPQIRVYVLSDEDAKLLPTEFEGYEVFPVVTGVVEAH